MALTEYEGAIVLEVDGVEIECDSFEPTIKTGRKPVKTMNSTGRSKGFSRGIEEITLKVSVLIPLTGDINWEDIEGAKLTRYPQGGGGKRVSFLDCYTVEVGEKYKVDNEAMRDLTMNSTRKIEE
ncbi:phage tail protein [Duganella sp. CY15W]|uniref:phage tail protein n=1 Tax=Duganella sp. CY15W TaxID=2692172 RepID=UPI00136891E6|nr:phage tail protein [Duganella sp. CY15W]MYM32263.1 phage tail protein [Duganella sp. CY15W]